MKYALLLTDSGFFAPVNAMLNAMKLYGNDGVDFYYLHHDDKATNAFVNSVMKSELADRFVDVTINKYMDDERYYPHREEGHNAIWRLKFYRYLYTIYELQDYDAVAIFDADMVIVNNIMPYFEIAAKTGKLLIPDNDGHGVQWDEMDYTTITQGRCPFHNMPIFFKPANFPEFTEIPAINQANRYGDMPSINYLLLSKNMMDRVIIQNNVQWLFTTRENFPLHKRIINGKPYLSIHRCGDRLFSFHGKWWYADVCNKGVAASNKHPQKELYARNFKLFWQFTRDLCLNYYHTIPWDKRWGDKLNF